MMNWYVLYTKPGAEDQVATLLRNAGIEVLNPKIRIRKYSRGRYDQIIEPLFRGYIFVRFDNEADGHMIRYTRGVRYIVGKDRPVAVPPEIIEVMQQRMEEGVITPQSETFSKGERVIVREGPFANFYGIFERQVPGRDRVVILLEVINSRLELEDTSVGKSQGA